MAEYFFEGDTEAGTEAKTAGEIPLKNVEPFYQVFLCYFDEARGHLPLYTYPARLKSNQNLIKIIKIHSIWFLDSTGQENLQHVDLEYYDRIYLALKFTGRSWRDKARAGLEKETPETYVLILSIPKQFKFLGSDLLMNLYSKIKDYADELYILIKKELASYKVLKSAKDKTLIEEGRAIEEDLDKICGNLLPDVPEDLDKLENIASSETRKNQKLAYLFLQELSQNPPPEEPRKFEIPAAESVSQEREERQVFIKPVIIKSIETIEGNQKLQIILKNQTNNLSNIRIQICRIEEFFETSCWETTVDDWYTNEELIFKYPISDVNERFQINVEDKTEGSKLLSKDIVAKDYIKEKISFFDTIKAEDFMDKEPLTSSYSDSIKSAVIEMNHSRLDYLIVTLDERPIGIITHRDILKKVIPMLYDQNIEPKDIKCKSVMSAPLTSIKRKDNIRKTALIILQTGVKKLPVLEDDKLVGIIRTNDLINLYLKQKLKGPDLMEKYEEIADLNKRTLGKIMSKDVMSVNLNANLKEVVKIMNEKRIGSIVVVDDDDKAIGIITERNVLRRVIEEAKDPHQVKAKDLMSSPLITLTEDDTIEKAINIMVSRGIRHIVIVKEDKPGVIEGIVSNTDILNVDLAKVSPTDLDVSKIFGS
jgi:predicted transcriptional regulator